MRAEDFFRTEEIDPDTDFFLPPVEVLNADLVRRLRRGPIEKASDQEVAVALVRLVHDELEAFGTNGGTRLTDQDMRECLLAVDAVLQRLGLPPLERPFRDLTTFRSHWLRSGASGSWQARRDILDGVFDQLHEQLADLETRSLRSDLADAVSPRGRTGWVRVDEEIVELRRHFQVAQTTQDYRNVGNDCVAIIEAVSRVAYDPAQHLRPDEVEPPPSNTKQRLGRVVEDAAPGAEGEAVRKLARAAIEMAQAVKHRGTPSRRDAGMAADATILLANLMRRLVEN